MPRGEGISRWCILRTSGRHTLRLAASLAEDGFEVWTPIEVQKRAKPSMNAKFEVRVAILPSFVFARSEHLIDLIQLAGATHKPRRGAGMRLPSLPDFRVMRCAQMIPFVRDVDLQELRRLETRRRPRQKAQSFARGARVKAAPEAMGYGGLIGEVIQSNSSITAVCFSNAALGNRVKIPTFLLSLDESYELHADPDAPVSRAACGGGPVRRL